MALAVFKKLEISRDVLSAAVLFLLDAADVGLKSLVRNDYGFSHNAEG